MLLQMTIMGFGFRLLLLRMPVLSGRATAISASSIWIIVAICSHAGQLHRKLIIKTHGGIVLSLINKAVFISYGMELARMAKSMHSILQR